MNESRVIIHQSRSNNRGNDYVTEAEAANTFSHDNDEKFDRHRRDVAQDSIFFYANAKPTGFDYYNFMVVARRFQM